MPPRLTTLLAAASLLTAAACDSSAPTDASPVTAPRPLAAKGSSGGSGGGTPVPAPAAPLTGTWMGENRWGPGVTEARRWTLTLTQSGIAFSGRLRTEQTTATGATVEGEGNVTAFGNLLDGPTKITIALRAKNGASRGSFVGTLAADGRTMRGVYWVPTVPASILGDTMTLRKQ
jgi:hypothetical protein